MSFSFYCTKQVSKAFVYLGLTIEADVDSSTEIRRRIVQSKSAMTRLHNVTCKKISIKATKILIQSLVFADDRRTTNAYEIWVW